MRKRILCQILTVITASTCICGSLSFVTPAAVYARSESVEEETDAPNAVKGDVVICGIFADNRQIPVTVDLCPTFEEGVHHYYTLTPDNSCIRDDVAIGTYRVIMYLADEDASSRDLHVNFFSRREEFLVSSSSSPEETPYIPVVIGSSQFIDKYAYDLTYYRDEKGRALNGVFSEQDAEAVVESNIEERDAVVDIDPDTSETDEGVSDAIKETNGDTNDIEYEIPDAENTKDQSTESEKPKEIPEATDEVVEKESKNVVAYLKLVIPAFVIIITGVVFAFCRRRRR